MPPPIPKAESTTKRESMWRKKEKAPRNNQSPDDPNITIYPKQIFLSFTILPLNYMTPNDKAGPSNHTHHHERAAAQPGKHPKDTTQKPKPIAMPDER